MDILLLFDHETMVRICSFAVIQAVPRVGRGIFRRRGGQFPRHANNLPAAGRRLEGRVGQCAMMGSSEGAGVEIRLVVADDDRGELRGQVSWARWQASGGGSGEGGDNVPSAAEGLFIFHGDLSAAARSDLNGSQGGSVRFTERE